MVSKVGSNSVLQEYFGVCQSNSKSVESPSQLLRKNRSLVAKLRSISDASSWMDEKKARGLKNIGWGEAARGWQPIKTFPACIATPGMKKLTKYVVHQKNDLAPTDALSVKLHWRDIVKYTSDVIVKPNLLSKSLSNKKLHSEIHVNSKLLDKNQSQKVSENHSNAAKKIQQILNRDFKFENNKGLEIRKKMRVPLDNNSFKKADRLAKLLRKLPKMQQQIKRDNKVVKRLSPNKSPTRRRLSPTKNRLNPTNRINIEYGSPVSTSKRILLPIQPHASKTRDRKTKASPTKNRVRTSNQRSTGEIAVKALELKTHMCLHVVLPSIESKPQTHLEYKKFATENLKFKKETEVSSFRRTSTPISIISKDTDFRANSALSKKVIEENFNWKFLPFLPPVLKQEDKAVQKWKGRRKPNTNLVAITKAAAKAGVSSNSINKLQRAALNGATTTTALPLTAFAVNSHSLIGEELATKM